ncbi:MAG: L-2-hydroxyglutarate oxidase [Pedosphaera sp.]|nr:L-2-hydroxyglutarate oxidase [Pedosphaera sp.]
MKPFRIAIVGGGIVGLSVAYKLSLKHPGAELVLFEKEPKLATHQTGRNSGVIHSGIYYKPASRKARMCRSGKVQLERFCKENGVSYETCGKVIVALNESELPALERIQQRGIANGVACEVVGVERLKELEPAVNGIRALHVPQTGIVDYVGFCERIGSLLREKGHELRLGTLVKGIIRDGRGLLVVSSKGDTQVDFLVNCAGLHSDRIARVAGHSPRLKIVPFRGEYFEVKEEARHVCQNLIYPVPDPSFPFLGVHFTRMIHGGLECGPNAVLAFAREGYTHSQVRLGDLAETLAFGGFRKLAARHWRMGLSEIHRSFSKKAFVRALQRLVPEIREDQLVTAPAGVRAQAVSPEGELVDDFSFEQDDRAIHVINAPSPAATACLAIADHILEMLELKLSQS